MIAVPGVSCEERSDLESCLDTSRAFFDVYPAGSRESHKRHDNVYTRSMSFSALDGLINAQPHYGDGDGDGDGNEPPLS